MGVVKRIIPGTEKQLIMSTFDISASTHTIYRNCLLTADRFSSYGFFLQGMDRNGYIIFYKTVIVCQGRERLNER